MRPSAIATCSSLCLIGFSAVDGAHASDSAQLEEIVVTAQKRQEAPGFNAKRDIAGIVLNRWGHALLVPPPGFYFGKDGKPAPLQVLRRRFGPIAFGHSELAGVQSWEHATVEGTRAINQVLEII